MTRASPCWRGFAKGLHAPVERRRDWVRARNPKWDVLQGECGCPAQLEFAHALCNVPWTEVSQTKWVLRRAMGDAVRGIFSSHFAITDNHYPNMIQSYGLVRCDLLGRFVYRRPIYYAMRNVYGFFDADVKPLWFEKAVAGGREISIARFAKKGRPVLVAWFSDARPDDSLAWKPNVPVPGVADFPDPVLVDLVTGGVYALPAGKTALPLRDSPVLVANRDVVEIKNEEAKK